MSMFSQDFSRSGAFAEGLERSSKQPEIAHNTLSDGALTCTYAELPELLSPIRARIRALFGSEASPEEGGTLALECPTSLPGALVLLAILAEERSLVLLPSTGTELGLTPAPRFCQYVLRLGPASGPPLHPSGAALTGQAVLAQLQVAAQTEVSQQEHGALSTPLLHLRTSGSMGRAKLVTHAQSTLLGNATQVAKKYGLGPEDRVFIPVPLAHMYGFGAAFLSGLLVGASVEVQGRSNLLSYLDREKRFQPTVAWVTPTHCEMLLRGFQTPRTGYRLVVTSGQRIPENLQRAFDPLVSGTLVNQYGSSELGAVAACAPTASLDEKVQTLGSAFPGVELRVMPDDLPRAQGVGLLQVRHPFGFLGYRDDDGRWLLRRDPLDWFMTGDLARPLEGEGRFQVVGRAGQSVNRRGYLIQLEELEQQLERMEGVAQAIAVPLPASDARGDALASFLLARPGWQLDAQALRTVMTSQLPAHAVPDFISVVSCLPLLPSGKVDRQSLVQHVLKQTNHSQEQNG